MTTDLTTLYTILVRGKNIREMYRMVAACAAALLFSQTSQMSPMEAMSNLYALLSGIASGFAVVCVHHVVSSTRRAGRAHMPQRSTSTM